MADEIGDEKFQPPYMSWATFQNIVETLGARGLPDQIDRSLLTSRSGGDQAQFFKAARSFALIDAQGRPLDRLKRYVTEPEERRDILREILNESYPSVVALGTGATPAQLHAAFREFGIDGDTVRKAETFYLNAARQAELELSPHFKNTRPGAGAGVRRRSPRPNGRGGKSAETAEEAAAGAASPDMHPAILTLVQNLPAFVADGGKPEFASADREAWFAYARATFNLIFALPEGDAVTGVNDEDLSPRRPADSVLRRADPGLATTQQAVAQGGGADHHEKPWPAPRREIEARVPYGTASVTPGCR